MSGSKNKRQYHILAVDDIPDNLILIEALLEDEGYSISTVTDGESALAQIEQTLPDLILLDVMMPGMDGYEVTRRIRQSNLPFIPILLVTAHDQSSVVKGLDAGADDFIRKPFDTDELLARVRSLLRLKQSIDEQREMGRQREDFVSRLTHDLRTPLVASNRMLDLFLQEAFCPISDDMRDAIGAMIRNNQNLLQMVNTMLEVYRHEAGQKRLSFAPCNMAEIAQAVLQELTPLAEDKGLTLSLVLPTPQDQPRDELLTVRGDQLELRRVLTNLIGNAIKFTDEGSIDVQITVPDTVTNGNSQKLVVDIKDSGPGISQDDQASLFERFRHGEHRRSGSGLGLYLSRCIVEAHGGTIHVQSELGQGSTFTVRLPLRRSGSDVATGSQSRAQLKDSVL